MQKFTFNELGRSDKIHVVEAHNMYAAVGKIRDEIGGDAVYSMTNPNHWAIGVHGGTGLVQLMCEKEETNG